MGVWWIFVGLLEDDSFSSFFLMAVMWDVCFWVAGRENLGQLNMCMSKAFLSFQRVA